MNILTHLQEIDDLIVEHTKPPITPILRNKLAFAIEQAEAHSSAVEKQERTLAKQVKTIERLMKENEELKLERSSKQRRPLVRGTPFVGSWKKL